MSVPPQVQHLQDFVTLERVCKCDCSFILDFVPLPPAKKREKGKGKERGKGKGKRRREERRKEERKNKKKGFQ